jgi:hypothetical protein
VVNATDDSILHVLPQEELLELFLTVSSQLSLIWNAFMKFHRSIFILSWICCLNHCFAWSDFIMTLCPTMFTSIQDKQN